MRSVVIRQSAWYQAVMRTIRCKFPYFVAFAIPLLLIFCSADSANADSFHYVNSLIGDRASGMGSAYTAVADDATGLYYNPAGIAYSTGANLSGSVNAYVHNFKKYDSVLGGNGSECWDVKAEIHQMQDRV